MKHNHGSVDESDLFDNSLLTLTLKLLQCIRLLKVRPPAFLVLVYIVQTRSIGVFVLIELRDIQSGTQEGRVRSDRVTALVIHYY